MIAVIVLPGPNASFHGLDRDTPLALLPLGDRPLLQHIVEYLALQGVRSFEFLLEHAPERVEQALGDGARWGCQFRYHLAGNSLRPYRSLSIIPEIARGEPWLLVHADSFPLAPVLQYSLPDRPVWLIPVTGASISPGTVVFPAGKWGGELESLSPEELCAVLHNPAGGVLIEEIPPNNWLCGHTPSDLLESQHKLLNRTFSSLMIGGVEGEPGIWISRNVVVHPSVKMIAPVFIGPNSRLGRGVEIGPNVVVGGNCVIDEHTLLRNSLVIGGGYIGEKLELDEVIVDRSLLVNARLGAAVTVSDNFLLGGLIAQSERNRFAQLLDSIGAFVLILLFLPFYVVVGLTLSLTLKQVSSLKAVKLPSRDDPSRWATFNLFFLQQTGEERFRPAGWPSFLWRFLPGLFAVLAGKLHIVGLPPRSLEEVEALPADWRTLYLAGKAGLITEASVAGTDHASEIDLYLAEACYRATRDQWYDLKLFLRYLSCLIIGPAGKSQQKSLDELSSPGMANQPEESQPRRL